MANGDDHPLPQQTPDETSSAAEMRESILRLQARQAELEAENQALRQALLGVAGGDAPAAGADVEQWRDALQERIKELRGLYDISALLNRIDLSRDALAQAIVDRLPAAYQYPEITCASLTIGNRRYATANYRETPWQQRGVVRAGEGPGGALTVGYLEGRPAAHEGPFLREERALIDEVCTQLGQALERRHLHATLADREAMLRSILTTSQDIIYRYRFLPEPGFDYVSPAVTELVGYTPEEHYADPELGMKLVHPDDRTLLAELAAGQDSTDQVRYVIRWVGKDGRVLHTEHRCTVVRDEEGRAVAYDGIARDITATVEHNTLMRAQDERYRALFLSSMDAAFIGTADGRVLEANPAASALFGWSLEEFQSLTRESLVNESDPRLRAFLAERDRCGYARGELTFMRKDGTTFQGEISSSTYQDSAGRTLASLFLHDVSARIQAHTQQQYLATVLANVPDAVISVDADVRILSWNTAAEEMYGWQASEVVGRSLGEVLGTNFIGATQSEIYTTLAGAGGWNGEVEQQHRNGRKMQVRLAIAAMRQADGSLAGGVIICRDMTAENLAQAALVASERRFRALIENAADGIVLVGFDRQLHYASPAAARIVGYSLEDLMRVDTLVIHPDDLEKVESGWQQNYTMPGEAISQVYRARHRDGSWHWLEATSTNLLADPAVEAVVVNFRDITERKLAEFELAASNARFQALFENMPLGVVYHEADGRISLANRAAEEILGLSHDQLMGRTSFDPCWKAVREDLSDFPGEEHPAMVALHTGRLVTDVLMGVHHPVKDELRWIQIAAVPEFRSGAALPYRVFAIFDDITERRHAEQHLARSEWLYRTAILAAGAIPYQHDFATASYSFMPVEAERLTGYSAGELTPALIESLLLEVNMRGQYAGLSLEDAVARARSGRDSPVWQCDYRVRTRSGEERWLADSSVQIVDDQGVPVASVGILQDITERMATEAALRASEERYRLLVGELEERVAERTAEARDLYESAPCGYSTIDATGNFTMVNQTQLEWLGFTRDEMIGRPVSDFLAPDGVQLFAEHFPQLVSNGAIDDLEFDMVCKDGSTLPVALNATAVYDAGGHFVACRGSIFDITQRRQAQQALLASEARLNHLLAHTPAIIFTAAITAQGIRTTYLSESTYRLLGYAPEAYRDDPSFWNSLVHSDDAPSGKESVQQLLATGSAIWEHRVRHADGCYRWHTTGMSLLGETDTPSQFVGYSVDIHERKLARDALRVSEERYRSVLQNAPVNISEVDRRGAILSQNRTLLGAPVETIVGKTLFDVAPPDAAPVIRHALDAVFNRGESVQYESSLEVAPGDVRHFVSYAGPVGADRIESAVVVTMDVSELKQTQAALQQQRDFAQQVMDALGEGLVVGDRDQSAAYVNPFMAHLLESTQSELLGGMLTDFALAEDVPEVAKMLAEHGPEATHRYELRLVTTSGRVVPTLVSTTPHWVNGELAGRIAVFTDLTRIKQIESELRQSGDELRAANVALEKAMQLKDEFLASMSHELRTPLTGILGLSESLQLQTFGTLNERQYRAVQYIWESGQHLLDLINDILDLSKLAADQLDLAIEHCDVDTICRASLTLVKGMAGKKRQQFAYALESHGIAVRADSRRLKQMLVNLLSNAVKFTPEGGELGLRVRGDSTRRIVEFHVWDTGIGIDAADLPRLFQPFTQLDSSLTREHSGSGLGLALVHRMAQLHGGTIEVVSEPGAGSTFTLLLPMDQSEPESELVDWTPPLALPGPTRIDTPSAGDTGGPRLLVAEDDPIISDILHELLTAKGYRVLLAANGRELLRMAPGFVPALVIMDVRMPQMDGIEATRRLRSDPDPALANVPIIILTAQAMEGDAERCLAAGANHYIAKPYAVASLLAAIETLLDAEDKPS